ncbi:MAG: CopG family transcriptional regulator [Candidatus Woesearchaeota archaeon]|nr:CopG family transcriptional regulator [Candidatus Woesearchaeota archaeon]MDP7506184.1 CopG family transcriptional regulator [Candidatus Woesearchaeota archaeon]MDP7610631.1 CopG family transcriptional regulator [Candidatus Woesearchaeota archaeon]
MVILDNKSGTAKIHVKLTKEQLELISDLKGILGSTNSEVVRTIVMSWLSEKSVIPNSIKKMLNKK